MQIFINCVSNPPFQANDLIQNYFEFNSIEYRVIDIFDTPTPFDSLIEDKNPKLYTLISSDIGAALKHRPDLKSKLIEFVNRGNYLWIWDDSDAMLDLWVFKKFLHEFDNVIKPGQVKIFLEGAIQNKKNYYFNNMELVFFNFTTTFHEYRIRNSIIEKSNCQKDYFTTTKMKKNRSHREILKNEVMSRPLLVERGYNIFRDYYDPWIGDQPKFHGYRAAYPSMDLYSNAWIELVSETFGEDLYLEGEKTYKPIQTKTPFLIQSTPGYLEYLKTKGFKTFSSLIDESYDSEPNLEKRTSMIADVLEDIIRNGAEQFYFASKDILNHNQIKLFEILGRKQYDIDLLIYNNLKSIGFKFGF